MEEIAGKVTCNLETLPSVRGGMGEGGCLSLLQLFQCRLLRPKVCASSEWTMIGGFAPWTLFQLAVCKR